MNGQYVLAAIAVAAAGLIIAVCRTGRRQQQTQAPAAPPRSAVLDTEPGINLALLDDCRLLWAMPAYGTTPDQTITTTEGD
ncbi:hypothetical protein ACIQ9J_01775 [Streptomyces sp. NPDC094153]|uniref:hypothetical protein n=1 Tax=Streptomyces sp. NPDC094153 TaxID=3366058 RepID=UPI003807EAA6